MPGFAIRPQATPDDGWRQTGANSWSRTNNATPAQVAKYTQQADALKRQWQSEDSNVPAVLQRRQAQTHNIAEFRREQQAPVGHRLRGRS